MIVEVGSKAPRDVFLAAVKLPPDQWQSFLDKACGGDDLLQNRVQELLDAHQMAGSFLQPAGERQLTAQFEPNAERPGTVIGPYKLLEQIGEGGMGVVFMAEQTRPVQRRVALKIIKAGMDTRQVVARFEAERQALAMMDHPNIARVLDAGATDTGRPYFVMELVRGVPMTEFCNQQSLTIRERLELFVTVCQAVQHAHQKGIIHRDIKPTNVLVTLHDGRPVIKVIDFGVAKATGQKLTDKTLFTGFTQMIGTPLYMSPEQAEMTSQDIDTRCDIFSCGVLLYELLTGTTPFDSQRLKSASFDELRRIIREEEPPRPSTRLTTLVAEAASTVCTQRKSDPRQLSRLFRGELDWIVMKCLEKDRTRRYETASALASDVERYLHDEPVQACPPSAHYRFGKFARRNKAALLTAAIVVLALGVGTAVSTWQAIRAYNSEMLATAREQQATMALDFLASIFRNPNPEQGGGTITALEILDRSAMELHGKFTESPLTKANLLEAIGGLYSTFGLYRKAIPLVEQARDLRIVGSGTDDPKTFATMHNLGRLYLFGGRIEETLSISEELLKVRKAKLPPEDYGTIQEMNGLAYGYLVAGRIDEAVRLGEESLRLAKAKLGPEDFETLLLMSTLAEAYRDAGRLDDAVQLSEELLNLRKAKLGPEHQDTLWAMGCLADMYGRVGRLMESVPLLEETLRLRTAKLGPENFETVEAMSQLAVAYNDAGRRDDGLLLTEKLLKLIKAKRWPENFLAFYSMGRVARACRDAGRFDEALQLDEEVLRFCKAKLGPEHPLRLLSISGLALDYQGSGRLDEAIRLNEETLKLRKKKLGPEHPDTLESMNNLAEAYLGAGRLSDALPLLEETTKLRKAKLGREHPDTLRSMNKLAFACVRAHRLAEAEPLARECLEIREQKLPGEWQTFDTQSLLGAVLLGQKKYAEAEPLLVSGYEGMHDRIARIPADGKARLTDALQRLVQLYEATNQPERAATWKAKLTEFDKAEAKENPAVQKEDVPPVKKTESGLESKSA